MCRSTLLSVAALALLHSAVGDITVELPAGSTAVHKQIVADASRGGRGRPGDGHAPTWMNGFAEKVGDFSVLPKGTEIGFQCKSKGSTVCELFVFQHRCLTCESNSPSAEGNTQESFPVMLASSDWQQFGCSPKRRISDFTTELMQKQPLVGFWKVLRADEDEQIVLPSDLNLVAFAMDNTTFDCEGAKDKQDCESAPTNGRCLWEEGACEFKMCPKKMFSGPGAPPAMHHKSTKLVGRPSRCAVEIDFEEDMQLPPHLSVSSVESAEGSRSLELLSTGPYMPTIPVTQPARVSYYVKAAGSNSGVRLQLFSSRGSFVAVNTARSGLIAVQSTTFGMYVAPAVGAVWYHIAIEFDWVVRAGSLYVDTTPVAEFTLAGNFDDVAWIEATAAEPHSFIDQLMVC
ncbi:hypothetical protein DIPPA_07267 [Diplonema papillatum]|nr:hypothetical protein DIPPA_07267 [Diplonema papillatum]